jgi:hypothetical protein
LLNQVSGGEPPYDSLAVMERAASAIIRTIRPIIGIHDNPAQCVLEVCWLKNQV